MSLQLAKTARIFGIFDFTIWGGLFGGVLQGYAALPEENRRSR